MSSPATIIIDESILDSYRELQEEGQGDVVTEFIDLFLDDLPGRLTQIEEAIQAEDPKAIRSAAHALKGSAASIGAARLSGAASELEALARSGETAGSGAHLQSIVTEASQAREALAKYRK